jgi:hypothetical protein
LEEIWAKDGKNGRARCLLAPVKDTKVKIHIRC